MHVIALLSLIQLAAPAKGVAAVELKPFDPVQTTAGKISREEQLGEEQPLRLMLDGEKILYKRDGSLEFAYLVPQLNAAGDDALLLAVGSDEPNEKACTKYLFVTVHKDGTAQPTDAFGDCTERFKVERAGEAVTVRFTGNGAAWTLQDGKLAAVAAKKPAGKKKH